MHQPPPLVTKIACSLSALLGWGPGTANAQTTTELTSRNSATLAAGNFDTLRASVSADGRFVVFSSFATNLVTGDTNNQGDVFLSDRLSGQITRISVGPGGVQGNAESSDAMISADGSTVVFVSRATTIVPGTNSRSNIFVLDRATNQITRVSQSPTGVNPNGDSGGPFVTRDGRFVAFTSGASNLVANDANGSFDSFVYDRQLGTMVLASLAHDGAQSTDHCFGAQVSMDGRYVVFKSDAANLVPTDTNQSPDVFRRDILLGTTAFVSTNALGQQCNFGAGFQSEGFPTMSDDGRYVLISSGSTNLIPNDSNQQTDLFRKDMVTGAVIQVNVSTTGQQGYYPGGSADPRGSMSSDGRYVAFATIESNLVPNDNNNVHDIFLRDLFLGQTTILSLSPTGQSTNNYSNFAAISPRGDFVAYRSLATNLVTPSSPSGAWQSFLADRNVAVGYTMALGGGCHGFDTLNPTLFGAPPVLTQTFALSGGNLEPNQAGAAFWCVAPAQPWPLNAECTIHLQLGAYWSFASVATDATGRWVTTIQIPGTPQLSGLALSFQGLFLTSTPQPFGIALTDAITATLGN